MRLNWGDMTLTAITIAIPIMMIITAALISAHDDLEAAKKKLEACQKENMQLDAEAYHLRGMVEAYEDAFEYKTIMEELGVWPKQ